MKCANCKHKMGIDNVGEYYHKNRYYSECFVHVHKHNIDGVKFTTSCGCKTPKYKKEKSLYFAKREHLMLIYYGLTSGMLAINMYLLFIGGTNLFIIPYLYSFILLLFGVIIFNEDLNKK